MFVSQLGAQSGTRNLQSVDWAGQNVWLKRRRLTPEGGGPCVLLAYEVVSRRSMSN